MGSSGNAEYMGQYTQPCLISDIQDLLCGATTQFSLFLAVFTFLTYNFQTKMLGSSLTRLTRASSRMITQTRGIKYENLPVFDPAAAIPMKWGAVYMGVFMAFWGLAYVASPFRERGTMDKHYAVKWQGKAE